MGSHSTMLIRAGLGSATESGRPSLPADLVAAAAYRVGSAGLLYSAGWVGSNVSFWLSSPSDLPMPMSVDMVRLGMVVTVFFILLGVVVWMVQRAGLLRPQRVVSLGYGFYVAGAFGIAMGTEVQERPFYVLTWVAVWLIAYAMVVPGRPLFLLLAAIAAALTTPAAVLIHAALGNRPPLGVEEIWLFATPNLVCAGLAYAGARITFGLSHQVKRARELGAYRLIDELGAGGMGEVWRAEHRMLARPAAIKLIRHEALQVNTSKTETVLRRFEREAQATAALGSPHTVELFDFGVADNGTLYYVMELLQGVSLEDLVRRFGPQPAERVRHVLLQVCNSLADAHENGLVHRDIKPANIFLCRQGVDLDYVKVLDFGLVTTVAELDGRDARLTRDGAVAGTPAYLAPEVAAGDAKMGPAADLYSLGCVAYWLLTGSLVFDNDSPMRTILDHVNTPPVPPSQRSELEIPEGLERVVMRCLEKVPAERFASARELAAALEAVPLEGWTAARRERWWQLHMPEERAA